MTGQLHIDPRAICESSDIGPGTVVRAFAQILQGARIGSGCEVHSGALIASRVAIGDRVVIGCNVHVPCGVVIEDDVTIGPNVSFTTDFDRDGTPSTVQTVPITVCRGARIGANATVLPGVTIGTGAVITPGTLIERSVPPHAIAGGTPARITGYARSDSGSHSPTSAYLARNPVALTVREVTLGELPLIRDIRGDLAVCEFASHMPFVPQRHFVVYNVPSGEPRGGHAHRTCAQMLIAVHGEVSVVVDDGERRQEVVLDSPRTFLHIPPMIWGIQYRYSASAVLLVMASHPYSADDYIRDYDQFRRERRVRS